MASYVQWPTSNALLARLDRLRDSDRHPAMAVFRADVRKAVLEGHRDGILAGTDKMGRRMKELAPSTLKNRKGTGPPLAPEGDTTARVISSLDVGWERASGLTVLVARFVGMDSDDGRPFMQYHLTGRDRLPKRDVGGIRPQAWAKIMKLHRDLMVKLLRG